MFCRGTICRSILALHRPDVLSGELKSVRKSPGVSADANYEKKEFMTHPSSDSAVDSAFRSFTQNSFSCAHANGPGGSALFLCIARVNHSCRPNAFRSDREDGRAVLVVGRTIARGEEITISYLRMSKLLRPRALLQDELRRWNFRCQCSLCCPRLSSEPSEVVVELDPTRLFICPVCKKGERAALAESGTKFLGPCSEHCDAGVRVLDEDDSKGVDISSIASYACFPLTNWFRPCRIRNLKSRPDLNGSLGIRGEWNADSQRWTVRFLREHSASGTVEDILCALAGALGVPPDWHAFATNKSGVREALKLKPDCVVAENLLEEGGSSSSGSGIEAAAAVVAAPNLFDAEAEVQRKYFELEKCPKSVTDRDILAVVKQAEKSACLAPHHWILERLSDMLAEYGRQLGKPQLVLTHRRRQIEAWSRHFGRGASQGLTLSRFHENLAEVLCREDRFAALAEFEKAVDGLAMLFGGDHVWVKELLEKAEMCVFLFGGDRS